MDWGLLECRPGDPESPQTAPQAWHTGREPARRAEPCLAEVARRPQRSWREEGVGQSGELPAGESAQCPAAGQAHQLPGKCCQWRRSWGSHSRPLEPQGVVPPPHCSAAPWLLFSRSQKHQVRPERVKQEHSSSEMSLSA
ncbi:hypothetical protein DR999_PMT11513 [Platysternon megacephalum]|uniref:Uncharacterized protein n=1 Tax=Platysternon megacephalum TaxID=55544 RepID=A0A4D9EDY2_9SAUR|nr:hypothetical protein DR999_PMT11513 [Platysternon megacephalum]